MIIEIMEKAWAARRRGVQRPYVARPTLFPSRTPRHVLLRILGAALLAAATALAPLPAAQAANLDTTADHVLGQPDFVFNSFAVSDTRLHYPVGVAVAMQTGRVFVADSANNRVVSWPNSLALSNGEAADLVLGQPHFFTNTVNNGGRS